MATYYVRPDGNDTNTGLAPTSAAGTGAWRTVNKALSVAVGGDTVWIAPGTYRENVTTAITGQTVNINVNGDANLTQVAWGIGLTAGVVRITNNLTNDAGTPSGTTLSLSTGRGPYVFANIRFDGWLSIVYAKSIAFNDCSFTGQCKETAVAVDTALTTSYTISFNRCTFYEVAFSMNVANLSGSTAYQYVLFNSCLMTSCANIDRPTQTSPGGSITNSWFSVLNANYNNLSVFMLNNCTILPGRTQPNYLFSAWNWSDRFQLVVRNCLILANPLTSTFIQDRTGQIHFGWCAAYTLTTTNAVTNLGNNITLTSNPFDFSEAYLQDYKSYAPYTPIDGSPLLNAGTSTSSGGITPPAYDFSNNTWTTVNPAIGYMDNRQVSTIPSTAGYVPLDRAVQTITTTAGSTGVSVHIYLGSTGVTFQTPNLTCYYARDNGASVQIPLVQGNASTWVSGGLFEVSSTTMPGVYKFDIPNAVIQAGAKSASIMLRGANAFNGAFVNVNIEAEPQPNYVSTNEFRLASEDAGYNNVLELNANTATTVKLQLLDMYQAPTNLTGATLSVEVYNSTNNLVASYTPTVRYAGNGEITFVLSTDVSATYGDYNVYCTKTSGSTDSVVYGPLSLRIRRL
jgi:hypothetical protein